MIKRKSKKAKGMEEGREGGILVYHLNSALVICNFNLNDDRNVEL